MCHLKKEINMETLNEEKKELINNAYLQYHESIMVFIVSRVKNITLAEDMSHDVFVRLISYKDMLQKTTIKSFIYTIAQNLLIDYFRRKSIKSRAQSYMYDKVEINENNTFDKVSYNNLSNIEMDIVEHLPKMQREVYKMSRYECLSTEEIAEVLNISNRTVETHLYKGRKEIRNCMSRLCV